MAGNGEGLVARRRSRGVFDLPGQVLDPVLQVLLVGADHLQTVKHCACGECSASLKALHPKGIIR